MPFPEIEDALVEAVAARLANAGTAPPGSWGGAAERLLREQPEVLAFVLAGTNKLAIEARAVAVVLCGVIYETFRLAGRPARPLDPDAFVEALGRNRDMAQRVSAAHDRIAERYLRNTNVLRQPALVRYVSGVLLEPDERFPHEVSRRQLGPLFIILKSVIDVLDADAPAAAQSAEPFAGLSSEPA